MGDRQEKGTVILRFRKLNQLAQEPFRGSEQAAGWDLFCTEYYKDPIADVYVYKTGIAVELPPGHVGLLFPRSSIYKYTLFPTNCVGVIDPDYRGEIMFKFAVRDANETGERLYGVGERIAQLIVMPFLDVQWLEVKKLSETKRGTGGYGSSGV